MRTFATLCTAPLGILSVSAALALEIKNERSVGPRQAQTIEIVVPAKYKLKSYRSEVKDDKNNWTTDPQVIGWGWWTDNQAEFTADGGFKIRVGYYNESGDRVRVIRIVADVD